MRGEERKENKKKTTMIRGLPLSEREKNAKKSSPRFTWRREKKKRKKKNVQGDIR